MSFCELARSVGFKVHAHIDSTLIHHGSYGYKGAYKDIFKQQELDKHQQELEKQQQELDKIADRNGF
jgi:hypothetical protein